MLVFRGVKVESLRSLLTVVVSTLESFKSSPSVPKSGKMDGGKHPIPPGHRMIFDTQIWV